MQSPCERHLRPLAAARHGAARRSSTQRCAARRPRAERRLRCVRRTPSSVSEYVDARDRKTASSTSTPRRGSSRGRSWPFSFDNICELCRSTRVSAPRVVAVASAPTRRQRKQGRPLRPRLPESPPADLPVARQRPPDAHRQRENRAAPPGALVNRRALVGSSLHQPDAGHYFPRDVKGSMATRAPGRHSSPIHFA